MIFLMLLEDLYLISHCAKNATTENLFVFHKDFLPAQVVRHIHALSACPLQENKSLVLQMVLTSKQDQQAIVIFQKLCAREKTNYAFAEQLQKTHLVELIHLITRIHLHASVES